jgi:hypothetical protein
MNLDHGTFPKLLARCNFCGEIRECIKVAPDVHICGEGLATALGNLTGWSMLSMYRTMRVQSDLRIQDSRNVEDITPRRRKRKL